MSSPTLLAFTLPSPDSEPEPSDTRLRVVTEHDGCKQSSEVQDETQERRADEDNDQRPENAEVEVHAGW